MPFWKNGILRTLRGDALCQCRVTVKYAQKTRTPFRAIARNGGFVFLEDENVSFCVENGGIPLSNKVFHRTFVGNGDGNPHSFPQDCV